MVFISLGSNTGDPIKNLDTAIEHLKHIPHFEIVATSSVYITEPQGLKEQPWFANQVLKAKVNGLSPITLLEELLKIETCMGRVRSIRWGPRVIDLDILLFENYTLNTPELIIPHPRMLERAFVLIPLLEIEPNITMPDGKKIRPFLDKLDFKLEKNRIWQ